MLTINTKAKIEKDFSEIIQAKYNGDVTKALISFIEYERMRDLSWNEKFQFQLCKLRQTAKKMGGINDRQIEDELAHLKKIGAIS